MNELLSIYSLPIANKIITYLPNRYSPVLNSELKKHICTYAWNCDGIDWDILPIELQQSQLLNVTLDDLLLGELRGIYSIDYDPRYGTIVDVIDMFGYRRFRRSVNEFAIRFELTAKYTDLDHKDYYDLQFYYIGQLELGGKKFIIVCD